MSALDQVILEVDELEALRLTNLLDLDQEHTAKQMGVSRSTVSRILRSACKKITLAVVEGHALLMGNGTVQLDRIDAPGNTAAENEPR